MVKRILPAGIVSFVVLAALGAVSQNVVESLPDAPSLQSATRAQIPDAHLAEGHPSLQPGSTIDPHLMRADAFATPSESGEKQSKTIFDRYLAVGSVKQQSSQHPSDSGIMGRATFAASRVLVARDDSGKGRLNTSYLVRALASVAADTASRPYWRRRSVGAPFSDFGSTVGNDAGMNLWHEFRPGIEQVVKSHAPRFVSRIEARIGHN